MKKILLTGRDGQVGWELQRTLAPLGEVTAYSRATLDLADSAAVCAAIRALRPDLIVNAAAYTAVDQAESENSLAMQINGQAPGVMAEESKKLGSLLVHYSTDYVFDGTKDNAYIEDDRPDPINAYGRSKLAGEQAIQAVGCRHLIFRTSWVYGLRGKNFLRTILRLAEERTELRIINDQFGAPTWSRMIAGATALSCVRKTPPEGLFHLASGGATSWHGFTQAILELTRHLRTREPVLAAIATREYPLPAARPQNSRLSCERLAAEAGIRLPDWRTALGLCLEN
ncbi:MAG: dTDP-4-dehydrorhamnose reductase [Betaproteobacteria bacterium]|nr:dTDP-4-dehydrorhamnose reductase [Betaproteobacteria bacterium]